MILVPALADIEKRSQSAGERAFARLLREVVADHEAVAFHSVDLRSHAYKQQAEADFVILWRATVIVVEVKGGGVCKHDGIWYSVDRRGDWHKLASSPMEQARSAAFALRDIIRQQGVGWFAHEAVVVTPDIDSPPDAVGWLPTHWLACNQMTSAGIAQAFDAVVAGARTAPVGQKTARIDDLRTRLFGEFTRMPVLDAQRGAVIEEQNRATAGQARFLAALAKNPRVLIYGGAGTGKSLALVEAAKQEADQRRSVLVTFRSPALAQFFATFLADRPVDVIPFAHLDAAGQYDVVMVDEAQDMMSAEAMDKIDAVIVDGRTSGRWRMFMDPNNQAHVDGEYDHDVAFLVADEGITVHLDLNVRNTRSMVHVVQEYLGADVGDPGIVHGEKVVWHTTDGPAHLRDAEAVAAKLVTDGSRPDDIWIIVPSSIEAPFRSVDGFTVTSPRWAKGLEAEHVVVCGLPEALDDLGVAALYVAVTRARVSLNVLVSKDDRRRLQQLLRQRMVIK